MASGSGPEDGQRAQQLELVGGRLGAHVGTMQRRPREHGHDGKKCADGQAAPPPCRTALDQRGSRERAGPDRDDEGGLHHPHHPREQVIRDHALEQCEARDVDQRVPHANRREGEQGHRRLRHEPDGEQRRAPEEQPGGEAARQPALADERHGCRRARDAAEAEGGVQEADPLGAPVEQLEGDHHHEHAERSGDERLRGEEAHDHGQLTGHAPPLETGRGLAQEPDLGTLVGGLLRRRRTHAQEQECRPDAC